MRTLGRAEPVLPGTTKLGEGPRWDARCGRLLWVDIEGGAVHVLQDGRDRAIDCGAMVGAVAPWRDDAILAALEDALAEVDLASGEVRRLAPIPHGRPGMRANDGACDPAGRFWIGTMPLDESTPGVAALHRYVDGALRPVLTGLTLANGIGWAGRRMYFIDTPTSRVDVLDYDPVTGEVAGRRPFAEIPGADGVPDGLALDDEGGVWVALHGGGRVRRFTLDGAVDGDVVVPVEAPTACAFAGSTLYVTARDGLYAAEVPFTGPPATPFAGP